MASVHEPAALSTTADSCPYARLGVSFYRGTYTQWQIRRGAPVPSWRKPRNCADAKYLAWVWAKRSYASRVKTQEHLRKTAERTLRDYDVRPGYSGWQRAVEEVQKVYPDTEPWLRSCSASEGGWGRWVTYGGGSDYWWAANSYVVGGWLQFKWPTFKGMYRHALTDVRSRGYIVPRELHDPGDIKAWLSPLAQALAGAWAARNGLTHHWVGHGC